MTKTANRSDYAVTVFLTSAMLLLSGSNHLCADDLADQLHAAAKRGDVESVGDLLKQGVNVDAPSKYQATALSFASQHGHSDVVKLLLEHNAKVDVKDTFYNLPPMFWASAKGHTEIVAALLGAGSSEQEAGLKIACGRRHPETVALLLDKVNFDQDVLSDILIGNPNLDSEIVEQLAVAGADADRPPPLLIEKAALQKFVGTYSSPDQLLYKIAVRGPRLEMTMDDRLIYVIEPHQDRVFRPVGDDNTKATFEIDDGQTLALTITTGNRTTRYEYLSEKRSDEAWQGKPEQRSGVVVAPANWPTFRGRGASGIADGQFPPATWDVVTGRNIRWKVEVPGLGHSCPIVWQQNILLTSATSGTGDHSLRTGQYGDIDSVEDGSEHVWNLYCVDKITGETRWVRELQRGVPKVKRHLKSTHANPTPATDGQHIVVSLGSEGLYCYDFDGNLIWRRDLGKLASGWFYDDAYEWGFGSSPIIYKHLVIQQCDVGRDSFIAAYHIETGQQAWRTGRTENPSWSTPTMYVGEAGDELITAASNFVRGYDPLTGSERWRMARLAEVTIPTPVVADGLVYVTSGYRDLKPIYAIRPGGRGDITLEDDQTSNPSIAWKLDRGGPYMPTPIAYRGHLYVCPNNGLLSCYDAATGERIWRKRLKNKHGYTASPVAADGKIYFVSESGEVTVVAAGSEFKLLARNEMNETCMATPAISDGMIFIRTQHHLYGIGATDRAN